MARASVGVRRVIGLGLVAILVAGCGAGGPGQIAAIDGANQLARGSRDVAPAASPADIAGVARANKAFALDIFRELAVDPDENVVIGPHSIWTALSMVWAGARGETASEIADVLHFDRPQDEVTPLLNALDLALRSRSQEGAVDLRFANQLFAEPGLPLLDEYLTSLTRDFGAPVAELEFGDAEAARQVINDWAADRTNGRIEELFPPGTVTPGNVLVLVNAISMDAAWTYQFDPALTSQQPFHSLDGATVLVPTMHFDLYMPLVSSEDLQAVEMPYGKGDLSMVVILPNHLDSFMQDLSPESLDAVFDAITEQGIHLSLPKFSFGFEAALDETLQRMGMRSAYGGSADFSGMTGEAGLFLDTVQHEAFIEVDEEGTEAHAATGAGMALSHGPTITIDRPFLFVIRDRPTGAILFMGRVNDPLAN